MKLNTYHNYQEYVKTQVDTNKVKLDLVWVDKLELEGIIKFIIDHKLRIKHGICHGVRNGWEVNYFRHALKADIIGTDIAESAKKFPHLIQWDFHKINPEWVHHFDLIYSNSLDHSYNPSLCLFHWMRCLNRNGYCFI